jgi:hypothetical protein
MKRYKIAILWRGDRAARAAATPDNNRYPASLQDFTHLALTPSRQSMPMT